MKYVLFIMLFVSILSLNSCDENAFSQVVDIDPPDYEKQMAVTLFLDNTPDSNYYFVLSRNFGILENPPNQSDYFVSGANLGIYNNNQLLAQATEIGLSGSDLNYKLKLTNPLTPNTPYELRISHPDYPTISSTEIMPPASEVISVDYNENAGVDFEGLELSSVIATIKDDPSKKNFYAMTIEAWSLYISPIYDNNQQIIGYDTTLYGQPLFPAELADPTYSLGANGEVVADDRLVSNGEILFGYKFNKYPIQTNTRIIVTFRDVTEAYYLYSLSRKKQEDADDNPFSEPVRVYSNFENGIGVFGLSNKQVFELE